jgi:hypothetical protein
MKYPCSDGVNRDADIDRYRELQAERLRLEEEMLPLKAKVEEISRELGQIWHELGVVGVAVLRKNLRENAIQSCPTKG